MYLKIINESCDKLNSKFKQKYFNLTIEDILRFENRKQELLKKLQQKLRVTWLQLRGIILKQ
jgi:hypothetical protein